MAKLLFIQRPGPEGARELNGVMAIARYIEPNHQARVAVDLSDDHLKEQIEIYTPDVIGLPVMTQDHFWAVNAAKRINNLKNGALTVLGGPHPTFYPKILEYQDIDAICLGEGEVAVKNLLDRIDSGSPINDIPSIWVRKNDEVIKNPLERPLRTDQLPSPKREIYRDVKGMMKTSDLLVMCSRGCPFDCTFCANYAQRRMNTSNNLPPMTTRLRDPLEVIAEIESVRAYRDVKSISFEDDIFGLNQKWLDKFAELYTSKVGLPFYGLLRFDTLSKGLVQKLQDMGVHGVAVGIETGDERLRNEILNKKLSDEQIFAGAEVLKSANLPFNTYIMFGLPGESLDHSYKSLDINLKVKADVAFTQIFHPFPGTKFFSEGGSEVEKAIISPEFSRFKINHPYSPDWRKIQRMQKLAMATVSYPAIRPLIPGLIALPLDDSYDKFSQRCWANIYDKQKREGFKKK